MFTLSKKCTQNTLTSHLVPHFRELCKNFETNALVINKVRVCSILKPGDNVQLSTGNVTEVNVTAGRAVGKKQTLVPRDLRPLNNKKSKMFMYRKDRKLPKHVEFSAHFNSHNSIWLCIEFEQGSNCDVTLARPMSSTRVLFLLGPRSSIYAMNLGH